MTYCPKDVTFVVCVLLTFALSETVSKQDNPTLLSYF